MSWSRLLCVAGLTGVVAIESLALPPMSRAADSPERTAALQTTIRHRQERRARLHAWAQRQQMIMDKIMLETMRMQQMQSMVESFLFESQRTGVWNHCSRCRSLVSPYASVGQNCPFCGAGWGGTGPGWVGP